MTKEDKDGIDIIIKPGTKNESVHIPVVISETGLTDLVYNDFFIGEDSDVTIIAGYITAEKKNRNMTVFIRFMWEKMQK